MASKALCIGINDYPGTQEDLSGCLNDANDGAAELTRHGFAVTQRIDSQADRASGNLLQAGCQDHEYSCDTSFHGRPNGAFT